ncbi:glycoside hydrolase family 95 protein [Sphaerisporangium corydalis]|uniref:Glycoside hydrolase N-terminal domain-containing protein n=1 Tax=Sphaerisporangium corydalis TaxID=1441875 RepID=A0ABV9EMU8_9ACTN|nr:glycoside hydrolase N-terminal domain-containing protein [Sphaerisporangium corydalis]
MLTLWYDRPADGADEHDAWERLALPIGNGRLGAMVFGRLGTERVALNESTLWTGGPGSKDAGNGRASGDWPVPRPGALDEVRRRIAEDGRMAPEEAARLLGNATEGDGHVPGFGAFQPFGDLLLDLGAAGVSDYRRALDLATAVASVEYTSGGARFTREYFASDPAQVVVVRVAADRPGQVSLTVRLAAGAPARAEGGRLTVRGTLDDNGLCFEGQVQVLAEGGGRTDGAGAVAVRGADAVTLVFSAGTDYAGEYPDYRGPDPHESVSARVERASARGYAALRAEHVADHRELFDRVQLNIGGYFVTPGQPSLPTDQALAAYGRGGPGDRALETLLFAYGRYLLIASSRSGSPLPANLQGLWNDSPAPPWDGDWHTNINVQMNYWPAEVTGLSECVPPLLRFVDGLRAPGRVTAATMFGASGWVVHQNTNPFGFTGVHDWPTSFWFPEAAAWLAQHVYEHYLFTGDAGYLRDHAYPLLSETAGFWLDHLAEHRGLVVSPSHSPEHGPFSAGAAMSQQIVWDLLANTVEAAEFLGVDPGYRILRALGDLDEGLRIGSFGQLQEWREDWDDPDDAHRHISHLFALHPGRRIRPCTAYGDAARVTLDHRGDGGTGWSRAWKMNLWARLLDGDRAHRLLGEQLRHSTLPNLWSTHPPFQIDGNLGTTAGIAEMLLQSHAGVVDVLPALPPAWPYGSFDGLRARGGHTVGATWQEGELVEVRLVSGHDGEVRLRNPAFLSGCRTQVPCTAEGDTAAFQASAGHAYRITVG